MNPISYIISYLESTKITNGDVYSWLAATFYWDIYVWQHVPPSPNYMCLCMRACVYVIRVQLFATLWMAASQAPLSMGFFQIRILEWVTISFSRGPSWPRDGTRISVSPALAGGFFTTKPPEKPKWIFSKYLFLLLLFFPTCTSSSLLHSSIIFIKKFLQ